MRDESASSHSDVLPGCALSLFSALFTCVMLFFNGTIVLAFLKAFARSGYDWARNPQLMQFLLLLLPVLMVIFEWMFIDYIRRRIRGR